MWWKGFCVVFFLALLSSSVNSASILGLFSSLSFSDHQVFRGYVSRLVQAGHSVVLMTPYPGQFTLPEAERIVELDVGQESAQFWDEFKQLTTNVEDHYTKLKAWHEFSVKLAIAQLKSKQMQALLINPNVRFDLVITEADVPVLYAAADKYKAPHIAITTSSGKLHQYEAKGSPIHPLLYPDVNTLNYRNISTWQKLVEIKRYLMSKYEYHSNYLPLSNVAAKKILGLTRDLQEVEQDIDLLVVAANPVLIGNRPSGPGVVYGDRMHIKPGVSLPQGLQEVLDKSTKGVVYFSIGAVQEAELLSPKMLQTLADTFRELPYTVLWKIGNTTAFNKPDNVIAQAWFPQQEILAHPNVKAFITHGGQRSLEEALFYEVPIVGLPIVKSRKVFIGELTRLGAGEIVDPNYLDKDTLKSTIAVVASNERYKNVMSRLKFSLVDPIVSGPEKALWWTECVLRNGGIRHLRSPAVGVGIFKFYLLDIVTYFLVGSFLVFWVSLVILRFIYKRLRVRYYGRNVDLGGKFKAL